MGMLGGLAWVGVAPLLCGAGLGKLSGRYLIGCSPPVLHCLGATVYLEVSPPLGHEPQSRMAPVERAVQSMMGGGQYLPSPFT